MTLGMLEFSDDADISNRDVLDKNLCYENDVGESENSICKLSINCNITHSDKYEQDIKKNCNDLEDTYKSRENEYVYDADSDAMKSKIQLLEINEKSENVPNKSNEVSTAGLNGFQNGNGYGVPSESESCNFTKCEKSANFQMNDTELDSRLTDSECSTNSINSNSDCTTDVSRITYDLGNHDQLTNCKAVQNVETPSINTYPESCSLPMLRNTNGLSSSISLMLTQDVPLDVNKGSSEIGDVLEEVPLVYLPITKQLSFGTTNSNTEGGSRLSSSNDSYGLDSKLAPSICDNPPRNCYVAGGLSAMNSFPMFTKILDNVSLSSMSSRSSLTESSVDVGIQDIDAISSEFVDVNLHSSTSFINPGPDSHHRSSSTALPSMTENKSVLGSLFGGNFFNKKVKVASSVNPNDVAERQKFVNQLKPVHYVSRCNVGRAGALVKPPLNSMVPAQQTDQNITGNVSDLSARRSRKSSVEVSSTTALILENRPVNLPSKTPEETHRHQQLYEEMVFAARKKEQRDAKEKRKLRQQQLKQEEKLMSLSKFWTNEVLPNWDFMRYAKKTQELWWQGLPPNVRGRVWQLAIGNDLNLTPELFEICLSRAQDRIKMNENVEPSGSSETSSEPPSSKEASVELIKLDVSRTFPQLCIFQKGGPYHDLLHDLLGAYTCYRPDVGYVQGMSFIAAVLLLNMDVSSAFVCFSNVLNRPCQVAFFRSDEEIMKSYFLTFKEFFRECLPRLYKYFLSLQLEPEVYLFDWMFTLYSKSLPLDIACRVWDVFCRDGEEFLFRTALGILKMYEDILLHLDFIHLAQFLTRLPDNMSVYKLFQNIESMRMIIEKKRFAQVLASFREAKDNT